MDCYVGCGLVLLGQVCADADLQDREIWLPSLWELKRFV